jgi:N-acetylglucosaminyldiphosphoundecaprenol N-acetyl-beta-D-mannosaminyltransferase
MVTLNKDKRYKIFNTYIDTYTFDETLKEIERIILAGKPTQHVVINAAKVNLMQKDKQLTEIVNSCSLINADGASIVWAAKKLGIPLEERVTGIDLFLKLVEISSIKGYRIFLFGAQEEIVVKVKRVFKEKYPKIQIAGIRNGYFKEDEEAEIVNMIAQSNSDILFVAFSSPQKEFWINKYLDQLNVPFVMGVGGSFDIVAGSTGRAPLWMQKRGLEWFYRFLQEPGRMWKRYLIGNAKYIILVYKTKFLQKKHKEVGI